MTRPEKNLRQQANDVKRKKEKKEQLGSRGRKTLEATPNEVRIGKGKREKIWGTNEKKRAFGGSRQKALTTFYKTSQPSADGY